MGHFDSIGRRRTPRSCFDELPGLPESSLFRLDYIYIE